MSREIVPLILHLFLDKINRRENDMAWKCTLCSKELTNVEYHEETEDVSDGWNWEVKHKEEYCNKKLH